MVKVRNKAKQCHLVLAAALVLQMIPWVLAADHVTIGEDNARTEPTEDLLYLVNAERVAQGLTAVSADKVLQMAAQWMAEDMAKDQRLSHTDSRARDLAARLKQYGYETPRLFAENIAEGPETPSAVVNAWLRSPPHRRNLLQPEVREAGVGHALDPHGQHYWVLDLGARFSHP